MKNEVISDYLYQSVLKVNEVHLMLILFVVILYHHHIGAAGPA